MYFNFSFNKTVLFCYKCFVIVFILFNLYFFVSFFSSFLNDFFVCYFFIVFYFFCNLRFECIINLPHLSFLISFLGSITL